MSKVRKRSASDFDKSDLFSDQEFNLHGFIDSMEKENKHRERPSSDDKISRQRIDDLQEAKRLRELLSDWDD
ncbi:MAG: hypothetical protein OEU36_21450 [Gammaproteobacteria bacterium]|nr:hypothetical protein [Gammaproteobacteria bacterium]